MSDSDSEPDFAVTTADLDMRDLFSNSEILLEVECQRTCANEEWVRLLDLAALFWPVLAAQTHFSFWRLSAFPSRAQR
jgi:hypothetical protein